MITLRTFLKHQAGSYSCVKPCAITMLNFQNFVTENLSDKQVRIKPSHDFHCTIVYSRDPVPVIELLKPDLPISAKFKQFSLFGENNDILVAELESSELLRIFNQSSDLGATSDWPVYSPHITLAKDASAIDISKLPSIDFEIIFDQYVATALDDE